MRCLRRPRQPELPCGCLQPSSRRSRCFSGAARSRPARSPGRASRLRRRSSRRSSPTGRLGRSPPATGPSTTTTTTTTTADRLLPHLLRHPRLRLRRLPHLRRPHLRRLPHHRLHHHHRHLHNLRRRHLRHRRHHPRRHRHLRSRLRLRPLLATRPRRFPPRCRRRSPASRPHRRLLRPTLKSRGSRRCPAPRRARLRPLRSSQ
jgi:hypothetical protein